MSSDTLYKYAYGQGSDTEAEFEKAFAALAYAYLKNNAPKLLSSMVGFQLVDRNEDNTRAFAIFGFRLGSQWLYAPIFFLNGELKGHQLLYLKSSDSFVPLSEKWVNYIQSRKPRVLGDPSANNLRELGGRYPDVQSLSRFSIGQHSKRAGDDQWVVDAIRLFSAFKHNHASSLFKSAAASKLDQSAVVDNPWAAATVEIADLVDLGSLLPREPELLYQAAKLAATVPAVKAGFEKFYGRDCLQKWAAAWCNQQLCETTDVLRTFKPVVEKKAKLQLYVYEQIVARPLAELDDADLGQLQQKRVLIKDERTDEERSQLYSVDEPLDLATPSESGIYRVLVDDGSDVQCVVLTGPVTNRGSYSHSVVFTTSDSSKYVYTQLAKVLIRESSESDVPTWRNWFDGLSSATLRKGGTYIALGPNKEASCLFTLNEKDGDNVRIDFSEPTFECNKFDTSEEYVSTYDVLLHRTKGTKFWPRKDNFGVPESYKFYELYYEKPETDSAGCCTIKSSISRRTLALADMSSIRNLLTTKTAELRVYSDGLTVNVRSKRGSFDGSPLDGLWYLVKDQGLNEDTARAILKEAAVKRRADYRIAYPTAEKVAAPTTSVLSGGPTAELLFDQLSSAGTEQYGPRTSATRDDGGQMTYALQQLAASNTDPAVWDNWQNYQAEDFQQASQAAQQASESGQKEIFDVGALSSMLKSVRKESLVDQHLGTLMAAIDSIGRIIINFYWHQQEFEDRYGRADLPELEDGLLNTFESLGDLAIFLKEKTVESALDLGEVNLDSVVGS